MCSFYNPGTNPREERLSMKSSGLLRFVFPLSLAASTLCAAQTYTVTDLGTLPSDAYSVARAINATGQITGATGPNNSPDSGVFIYSNGSLTNLGTLGGPSGIGNGINASGQVAGYSQNASRTYRAFISNGNTLTDIGDLGGSSAVAYAINDLGQVVGSAVTSDGSNHPFLYSSGQMIDLGTLGSPNGNSWWNSATGVNKSGAVTGTSYDAQGNFFGFVWENGTMKKLGTLGGPWSQGYAINNNGQVTGLAYTADGNAHAFITNAKGKLKDLGVFAGKYSTVWGFGINDSGVVVGQSTFQGTYHAFVYNGLKIKDLNALIPKNSGWELIEAFGINNAGQITGTGMHKGQEHAYLLTPH
jgi:probable HAF family extracellular repeat protein